MDSFPIWAQQPGARVISGDFDGNEVIDLALAGGAGWGTIPVAFSDVETVATIHRVENRPAGEITARAAERNTQLAAADFDGDGRVNAEEAQTMVAALKKLYKAARAEKASIPAFVRMARELERLGAPSALQRAALAAAEDEARHTDICLNRAHAASCRRWSIEELDSPSRLADLATLAEEAWLDGCLGEGKAAEALDGSARQARKLDLGMAIASVASDEGRHAELAWAVLDWTLREGGSGLRDRLAEMMWRAEVAPEEETTGSDPDDPRLDQDLIAESGVPPSESLREAGLRVEDTARRRLASLIDRTTTLKS